jgi:3-oxoacyl-[acyl-carrier-protein] synthase-3
MAVNSAHKALAVAGISAAEVDLIIAATSTPDYFMPAVSSTIQAMVGANCPAFTISTGCTAFVYGLVTAHQYIATGACKNVLVIGVELVSRFVDWQDRDTCVLFGDGAGAVVVSRSQEPGGLLAFDLGSDGEKGMVLRLEGGGCAHPMSHDVINQGQNYLRMNGREVFKFATRILPQSTQTLINKANLSLADIDLLIPHQANRRIIDMATRSMGLDENRVYVNVHKYGNTSAASIPLALVEALEEGRVKPGDKLALVSFGAGLTWASALLQWTAPVPALNGRG